MHRTVAMFKKNVFIMKVVRDYWRGKMIIIKCV